MSALFFFSLLYSSACRSLLQHPSSGTALQKHQTRFKQGCPAEPGPSTFSLYSIQRESSRKNKKQKTKNKKPLHWTFRDDFTDTERGSRAMAWAEVASLVAKKKQQNKTKTKAESSRSLRYQEWTPAAPHADSHAQGQTAFSTSETFPPAFMLC